VQCRLLWLERGFGGKVGTKASFYGRGAVCDGRGKLNMDKTIAEIWNAFKNVPDLTIVEAGVSIRLQHSLKRMFHELID
jgi:hypothetical protein